MREPGGGDEALRTAWESTDPAGTISRTFSRAYTAPDLSEEERWTIAREIAPGIGEAVSRVYRDSAATIGGARRPRDPPPYREPPPPRLLAHAASSGCSR
ncbi:hypothetical protein [Methanoculleus chikugoensis]|uniref:hypothetical protein n=1 Tax=Methanoculleus chikugoensis TaxID=118126 RepID=UPI0006D2C843|nr:hypothetical protein [Methanoculleus chikugoensis]